jgi:hypothetical protein
MGMAVKNHFHLPAVNGFYQPGGTQEGKDLYRFAFYRGLDGRKVGDDDFFQVVVTVFQVGQGAVQLQGFIYGFLTKSLMPCSPNIESIYRSNPPPKPFTPAKPIS